MQHLIKCYNDTSKNVDLNTAIATLDYENIKSLKKSPREDEFLDVIYWARQIFGILLGIVWGIVPLKGFLGLVLFAGISCGIVYIYSINFQGIDEEAYGGAWELVKEDFMTSFAGFLVTWIIFYTGLHYDTIMAEKELS
ncbi:respirasome Complex Assembly Factor 1-like [Bactrocera tryoni]|uniref:respirasome Complex Assembly Factor 1-like n=1 Tax=Bactrocera tryoni TaxID=59916 RepID=UPI001A959502|nr:respirasome Complex Assembly Factor 1-like [Bactrocera tryoni]